MRRSADPYRKKTCFWQLHVRKDSHDLVLKDCKDTFIKDNPGYARLHITHDFIVRRIALYYLHRIDQHSGKELEKMPDE